MSYSEGQPIPMRHKVRNWTSAGILAALPILSFAHPAKSEALSHAPQNPVSAAMGNEASHVYNNIPLTYISSVATDQAGNVRADSVLDIETTNGKSNYAFYEAQAKHAFRLVNSHLPSPENNLYTQITPNSSNPNEILLSGSFHGNGQFPTPVFELSTDGGKDFINMSHAENVSDGNVDVQAIPETTKVLLNYSNPNPDNEGQQDFGIFDFATKKFTVSASAGSESPVVAIEPDTQSGFVDIFTTPSSPGFQGDQGDAINSQMLDVSKLNLNTLKSTSKTLVDHFPVTKISPVKDAKGFVTDLIGVTPDGNGGEAYVDYRLKAGKIVQQFPFSKYNFPEDLTVESIIKVKDNVYFSGSKIPGTTFIAAFKDTNMKVTDEKILNDPNMDGAIYDLQKVFYGGQESIRAEAPNGINVFPLNPDGSLQAAHISDAWLANNGIKLPKAEG